MIQVAPNGVPYLSMPDGDDIYSMWRQTQAYQNEVAQQRAVPPGINPADVVTERMYVAHGARIDTQRAANLWGESIFPENYVPSTIRHLVGTTPPPPNAPAATPQQSKPKTGTINDILGDGNWELAIDKYPDDYEDTKYQQYEHTFDDEPDTDPNSIDEGDWYWRYMNNAGYPLETPWWQMPEYRAKDTPKPTFVSATTTPPPGYVVAPVGYASIPQPKFDNGPDVYPMQYALLPAASTTGAQQQQPVQSPTYNPQASGTGYYGPAPYQQQPMYNQGGFQTTQFGGSYMNFGGFQPPPPPQNHIPGTIPFFNNPYQQQATYQHPYPQFYNYGGPVPVNKIEIICRSRPDLAKKYGYTQYCQPEQNQGSMMNPYMQQQVMNSPMMMYQQQQAYMKERLEMEKLKWKMRYKMIGREDEYNEEEIERMILGPQAAAAKPMTEEQLKEEELWARTMRTREAVLHPMGETDAVRQANIIREHSRQLHAEMDNHDIFTFFNEDLPKLMREFWIEDNILIPNAQDAYQNQVFGNAISKFQEENPGSVTASYEALKAEQEKRMQEGGGLTAMGGYTNFLELRDAHRKMMEGRVPSNVSDDDTVEKRNAFTSNLVDLIDMKEERRYKRLKSKEGGKPK